MNLTWVVIRPPGVCPWPSLEKGSFVRVFVSERSAGMDRVAHPGLEGEPPMRTVGGRKEGPSG